MSMDHSRRDRFARQPVPLTWELPAAIAAVVLIALVLMPLVIQGLMGMVAGDGFAWPHGRLVPALLGLTHGRFGVGLPVAVAVRLPVPGVLWAATVAGDVIALGVTTVAALVLRDVAGLGARHGLATRNQAAGALGRARLRAAAPVIRPDLHRPRRLPRPRPGTRREGKSR